MAEPIEIAYTPVDTTQTKTETGKLKMTKLCLDHHELQVSFGLFDKDHNQIKEQTFVLLTTDLTDPLNALQASIIAQLLKDGKEMIH